jgi:hypothetical protein
MIEYRFFLPENRSIHLTVDRQRQSSVFPPQNASAAAWTRLEFNQCPNCPLKPAQWPHCPAALDLAQITTHFGDLLSFAQARVEVITPERTYVKDCDVQTALRSLLGLAMATSGCPVLSQFRALATTHLPFSTLEETLFRTTSAYLLKQYFIYQSGGTPDWDLKGLETFYEELQRVNRSLKSRLDSAFAKDANLNAIGSLLYVTMGVSYSIGEKLSELRGGFCPPG